MLVGMMGSSVLGDEPKPGKPSKKAASIKDISAVEAKEYLTKDAPARDKVVILDIRTKKEYRDGHLKGAKNIDFLKDDFKKKLAKLDRKRVYVMHCRSGGRSGRAKKVFQELGFEKVLHISDGYQAWVAAGFPVEKEKGE